MPRFQGGDQVVLREGCPDDCVPPYLAGRSGVIVRYTGSSLDTAGEEQAVYLTRFLRMTEGEQAEHSLPEAHLTRVSWPLPSREVPFFSGEIKRHQALHGSLAERRRGKAGSTDVNHGLVLT